MGTGTDRPRDIPTPATLVAGETVVCDALEIAATSPSRMKGLLGRTGLADGEGLWITPCSSIHMFFMRFAIDAVFVDEDLQVTRVHSNVRPWRMARGGAGAHSVFELPTGRARACGLEAGTQLHVRSASA